ncbi:unnamed protein product [Cylindrotheca closterium]|uniref:S-adenosylmethionine-dependent methyltransferase domain-containing protein n=1 Tax=Cylindrotheca closterium TaxID=2856 RepID=A0AAD2FL76_9STRA|nr:unnamed protein product [Cylindrotheca closterium]
MYQSFVAALFLSTVLGFQLPGIDKGRQPTSLQALFDNKKAKITIKEMQEKLLNRPESLVGSKGSKGKNVRRTRRRVENPQQQYMYRAQKDQLQREGKNIGKKDSKVVKKSAEGDDEEVELDEKEREILDENSPAIIARQLGLTQAANQHCEAPMDKAEPIILAKLRVGDGNGSDAFAYLIDKPAGWSILGGNIGKKKKQQVEAKATKSSDDNDSSNIKRVKIKNSKGSDDFLEFDEDDVLALLSPKERAQLEAQGEPIFAGFGPAFDDTDLVPYDIPGWDDVANMTPEERAEAGITDEDYDPTEDFIPAFSEAEMLALMSPEEIAEYEAEKQQNTINETTNTASSKPETETVRMEDLDPAAQENIKRMEKRKAKRKDRATFGSYTRPSVVNWLKELKAESGQPIRGGKFWTAAAGATEVDDSGVVLLCPKSNVGNVFVDTAEYAAVVGNGGYFRQISKADSSIPGEDIDIQLVSKVRKGREGDTCQTVRFEIPEHKSTCANIIEHAQSKFNDGIRGDPAANPFDRRSPRRLIHCFSLSASSLISDEDVMVETETMPDDIAILSDRLNNHDFKKGSFLGRTSLRENPLTNAYREINGAADGFPGWTVDRYDEWLLVAHDEKEYKGPLPSIHDGKTAGVYYIPSNQDRSAMGSSTLVRPKLLEGKPAPEIVSVKENGVTYHVSLDKDLSTGIFLDQRPHRAWLTRNCNEDTHVLNCFAHCGAFSIAAATAGASTVSLDLSKKWLDRVPAQLEANGIEFDERHDCIYGDCFDWLAKLAKRGEKFDIVILDPPSSSVGKKKKRWSVRNDMHELVALAAPLVKKGGLLWTTTNSASLTPIKFARSCERGFEQAGCSAKLERIQPMPHDFPTIGPQNVKNMVWRF